MVRTYYCQAECPLNSTLDNYSPKSGATKAQARNPPPMARIYLASSWRNPFQPKIVQDLRAWGHAVYDFRHDSRALGASPLGHTEPPATAFSWAEMDPDWKDWKPREYLGALQTSARAAQGFIGDLRGMEWADTCVMALPCGNSAHIEAGYMKGRGKRLIIYWERSEKVTTAKNETTGETKEWTFEPDLMYLLADNLVISSKELMLTLGHGL
jgi:nucleoside 2-deoxyribosyltransferase